MEQMANYQWYSITHQRKDLTRTRKPPGLFPEVEPEVVSEGEQPDDDAGLGLAAANVESGHEDGSSTGCNK